MKAFLAVFLLYAAGKAAAQGVGDLGVWSDTYPTWAEEEITVAAAAQLPNGDIMAWAAWMRQEYLSPRKVGQTYTVVINPFDNTVTEELVAHTVSLTSSMLRQ